MNQIPKIVLFAKATEGEALVIANSVIDQEMAVAEVVITKGLIPAIEPVCWIALPKKVLKLLIEKS